MLLPLNLTYLGYDPRADFVSKGYQNGLPRPHTVGGNRCSRGEAWYFDF